jgi:hypothetical protein
LENIPTGVTVYDSNNQMKEINKNYRFTIKKEIEKLIKKNNTINKVSSISSLASAASSISKMEEFDPSEKIKISSFLAKKRIDFTNKLYSRKALMEGGFLKKNKETCVNTDGTSYGIHDEIYLNKDDLISEVDYDLLENNSTSNYDKGIILKSNNISNQVVAFNTFSTENSVFKDNIKSVYCGNLITSADENSQIFMNMFNKISRNSIKNNDNTNDDCFYLQIIIPSNDLNIPSEKLRKNSKSGEFTFNDSDYNNSYYDSSSKKDKKIYYEVGCKIFEMNKIYK